MSAEISSLQLYLRLKHMIYPALLLRYRKDRELEIQISFWEIRNRTELQFKIQGRNSGRSVRSDMYLSEISSIIYHFNFQL